MSLITLLISLDDSSSFILNLAYKLNQICYILTDKDNTNTDKYEFSDHT